VVRMVIATDELYPCYKLEPVVEGEEPTWVAECAFQDFTEEEIAEFNAIQEKFDAWQDKLAKRIETAHAAWVAANPEEHKRRTERWERLQREDYERRTGKR